MLKLFYSCLFAGCLLIRAASSPSIGLVKSTGEFRVDGSTVPGNGTVFEGNVIETLRARAIIELGTTRLTILPQSRARVFRTRTILEKGAGLWAAAQDHTIETATLRVTAASHNSKVQVEVSGPNRISIYARDGDAEVRNTAGMLVASLNPGMALAFETQGAGATAVKMTGTLVSANGRLFLTDKTTNVRVELKGQDLAKYVGQEVEITGSSIPGAAAAGASQIVQVTTIELVSNRMKGAPRVGARGTGGSAAGGLSSTATAAIVGGVAVGGTVAGMAGAGMFSSSAAASRQ